MKRIITYGTFDLFHEGHLRILERAKKLGSYLIVGITTDGYDESRGKLNVKQSLMERIENVKKSGLADEIIIEEYEGQKVNDIQKYQVDVFTIGSDWLGKFDYLNEYCDVVYLERTRGVSSTELRNTSYGVLSLGIVGCGRIAQRFYNESRYVSGVNIECVYGRTVDKVKTFAEKNQIKDFSVDYDRFLGDISAVYIATPHGTHFQLSKQALLKGKHVLCEKPATLRVEELEELQKIAIENNLVFLEAVKTAFSPGFIRMIAVAKSGLIGNIVNVDASFTKIYQNRNIREFSLAENGGAFNELATYPLLAIAKLLGTSPVGELGYAKYCDETGVNLFTKMNLQYENAIATFKVGIGVKTEGDLVVSGTKGYLYVPAPWWLTEYFEVRFEDQNKNRKYFYKFDGDGLRYELSEFLKLINTQDYSHKLTNSESLFFAKKIESFNNKENINFLI